MAGRPHLQSVAKRIEDKGGEVELLDLVRDGKTTQYIADWLGVERKQVYRWLNSDPERRARYDEAKRESADAIADDTEHLLETADPKTPFDVALLAKRVDNKRWMAGRLNPEAWGDRSTTNVTLNLGQLHLDALRAITATPTLQALPTEIVTDDTKCLNAGEEETE